MDSAPVGGVATETPTERPPERGPFARLDSRSVGAAPWRVTFRGLTNIMLDLLLRFLYPEQWR